MLTTRTGDRDELDHVPPAAVWHELAVGPDRCRGGACRERHRCFSEAARGRAGEVDVVLVNHALYMADLALRAGSGGGAAILPAARPGGLRRGARARGRGRRRARRAAVAARAGAASPATSTARRPPRGATRPTSTSPRCSSTASACSARCRAAACGCARPTWPGCPPGAADGMRAALRGSRGCSAAAARRPTRWRGTRTGWRSRSRRCSSAATTWPRWCGRSATGAGAWSCARRLSTSPRSSRSSSSTPCSRRCSCPPRSPSAAPSRTSAGAWASRGAARARRRLALRARRPRRACTCRAGSPATAPTDARGRRDAAAGAGQRRARAAPVHVAAAPGRGAPPARARPAVPRAAPGRRAPRAAAGALPARRSTRCSSGPPASGRASTCPARRCRWWCSTSCRSPRRTSRSWRRGSSTPSATAAPGSSTSSCRAPRCCSSRATAGCCARRTTVGVVAVLDDRLLTRRYGAGLLAALPPPPGVEHDLEAVRVFLGCTEHGAARPPAIRPAKLPRRCRSKKPGKQPPRGATPAGGSAARSPGVLGRDREEGVRPARPPGRAVVVAAG